MLSRRRFLQSAAVASALPLGWPGLSCAADEPRKKLAIICTHWTMQSHAQHMGDRFLTGYPWQGKWHRPPFEVVAVYTDQQPKGDLAPQRAMEYGFTIYPTIAEAVCCGGKQLAVDAVLVIGEHGDYPLSPIGQKQYPRYEFFQQITQVYRNSGRSAPIFNDKHLSWNYEWAKSMVATSKELGFGFCAGSSLPVTWRLPAVDMPLGAQIEEALVIGFGPVDIYDFHALETLQCMVERRAGGETGVKAVQALRGEAVWDAMDRGGWAAGSWDPALFEACLSRSHTLKQAHKNFGHRYPSAADLRQLCKEPIAYRIEYRDGLKATMLLANGVVTDFTFAARLAGDKQPLSTQFLLPPQPNVAYSSALMSKAEETFVTNKSPTPIERTLLTSGLVTACMTSLVNNQQRLETPQLDVRFQPPATSQFVRD